MILKPSRVLLSKSELFNVINSKRKLDISFLKNTINLSQLKGPIADIKLRRFPALRQIMNALTEKKIILCHTSNNSSGIVYSPVMDKQNKQIVSIMVNLSKFAKKQVIVNTLTGDTEEVLNINYEILYNLLFGAVVSLNSRKCYLNGNLVKYLRTIYTDMMVQILTRSFGNAVYGDRFRFVIGYFFHNGEINAKDLAQMTKFDENKAAVVANAHPEFFSGKELKVSDLLDLITEEFSNMKDVNMDAFIAGAVTMLGDSAFYLIDNQAYFLGIITIKCRRDKDIFTGHLLRSIEADKGTISSLILQSI